MLRGSKKQAPQYYIMEFPYERKSDVVPFLRPAILNISRKKIKFGIVPIIELNQCHYEH